MKYIIKDIRQNKVICSCLFVLNVFMLVLFLNILHIIEDTKATLDRISVLGETDAYIVQDTTDELKFEKIYADEFAISKVEQFFKKIRTEDINFYSKYGYDMYISEHGNIIRQESVTNHFFELYGMTPVEGRLFTKEEYDEESEIVPIVVGYNLQEEYKVGNVYEFDNGGTGETFKGKVIGRLKQNSTYLDIGFSFRMTYSMDNSYIIPIGLKDYNNENLSFSDCDMALTSMVILSDDAASVKQGINEMDLFELSLINVEDRFKEVVSAQVNFLYLMVIGSSILALLIISVMWILFNRLIKKQMYEFGIHLLCGARPIVLIMRVAALIYIVQALSVGVTCIFTNSFKEICWLSGTAMILGLIILLFPACKLKFSKILYVMRSE